MYDWVVGLKRKLKKQKHKKRDEKKNEEGKRCRRDLEKILLRYRRLRKHIYIYLGEKDEIVWKLGKVGCFP